MALVVPVSLIPWHSSRLDAATRHRREARLRRLAVLMDSSVRLPGTSWRIGLDGIIGLVPGVGDAVGLLVSAYIVFEARRLGATRKQLALMTANVLIDAMGGTVPIVGDVFDFAFKANVRNLRIMGIELESPMPEDATASRPTPPSDHRSLV